MHGIEVHLMANIEQYKRGMEEAKKVGGESMGFIASIFDAVKRLGSGMWDSLKSAFSGIGSASKGTFESMSDSASSAFQKIGAMLPTFHAGLDKTKQKMGETEEQSDGLMKKIGIGIVATVVAAITAIAVLTKKGIEADAALAGLAISSGIAASQISRFEETALRSNVSAQDFGKSMGKLHEEMAKAAAGDGVSFFDKLGVKVVDANNALLKTDDVTIAVAKKIAAMSTETEKYAAAAKLGFEGKVQVLEDIARATNLTATTTDDQAAAVVRLGKIWHDILPGGKSMWAQISTFLSANLTPAVTEASVGVLSAKNKILDAFQQIFSTSSMFPAFGEKIKAWGVDLGKWFAGVADGAANVHISLMRLFSAKTGIGNANAPLSAAGAIPGIVPLTGAGGAPVVKEADSKQLEEYAALTKVIKEKTEAQRLEGQVGASLTEGQRMAVKMTTDLRDGTLHLTDAQKVQRVGELNALIAIEKSNISTAAARSAATAAADKESTAYAALISAIRSGTEANRIELSVGENATAAQKERAKMDQELASGKLVLTAQHKATARAALDERDATEALLKVQKGEKDTLNWIIQSTEARLASKAALEIEYATYGKVAEAHDIANIALKINTELEKDLNAQRKAGVKLSEESVSQMRVEAAERIRVEQSVMSQSKALGYAKQLADENKKFAAESIFDERARGEALLQIDAKVWEDRIRLAGEGTEAQRLLQEQYVTWYQNQASKPMLDVWQKSVTQYSDIFRNGFADMLNNGKSGWASFTKSLTTTFKTGVADQIYKMLAQPFVVKMIGSFLGVTGGGIAGAAQAASGAGGALSAAGSASSLYNTATGGMAGLTNMAGSGIASMGGLIGSSSMSAFGAGFAGVGTEMMTAAETFAGAGMAAEATAASLGSAFAAAVPWVGAALAAVAVWNKFFEDGPESNTRLQFASNNAVGNINNNERGESWAAPYIGNGSTSSLGTFGVRQTFWGDANGEVVQSFIKTVGQTDDALAAFMTTTEKASVTNYLTGKTYTANTGAEGSNPNANGELDKVFADRINNILTGVEPGLASLVSGFSGTSQALATEAAALLSYRAALKDSGEAVFGAKVTMQEIAALKLPTETTSAALIRVTNEFTVTSQVAQMLGVDVAKAFGTTGLASEAARAQLILLSGGLQTFSSQSAEFAQTYMTEEERNRTLAKQVGEQMAALGYASITTKDQFKELVLGLVSSGAVATEAGAKQYAALMSVSAGFAAAADATKAAVEKMRSDQGDILDLQAQMYEANGDKAGAAAVLVAQHTLALQGMTPALAAATQATWAAQAVQKVVADAQAESNSLLGIQAQIYEVTGNKAGAAAVLQQQHNAALALLSPALQGATKDLWAAQAVAEKQKDATAAYASFGNAMQSTIDKITTATQALRDFSAQINSGDLSPLSANAQYSANKAAVAAASPDTAQAAVTAFLKSAQGHDTTRLEYSRDVAYAQAAIQKLIGSQDSRIADTVAGYSTLFKAIAGMNIGAHANGGVASGWSLVGEQGPELVNFSDPGRVYTASQSREMMGGRGGGGDNATLIAEVKRLGDKLDRLHAATEATALNTSATTRVLKRVIVNDVLQTEVPT